MPLRAVAPLALVAVLLSGCSDDEPEAAPEPTPSSAAEPEPSAPEPTEPSGETLDPLDWQSEEHRGIPQELHPDGDGFIGFETDAVSRLDASGEFVWRYEGRRADDLFGLWVGGRPVVVQGRGDRYVAQALDPATGEVEWTVSSTSREVVTDGERVVVPDCESGACTLSAVDGATGDYEWDSATYPGLRSAQAGAGVVVAQTVPSEGRTETVVLDAETGVERARIEPAATDRLTLVGDVLVGDGAEPRPTDGCRQQVTAYDLDGELLWKRTFELPRQKRDQDECDSYGIAPPLAGVEDRVVLQPVWARPLVLDVRTGKTGYAGPQRATVDAEAAGLLLVAQDRETRAVDAQGAVAWTRPGSTAQWYGEDGLAATTYSCPREIGESSTSCTVVVDATTGADLLHVPGLVQSFVDGGGLLVELDAPDGTASAYGYLTLPAS